MELSPEQRRAWFRGVRDELRGASARASPYPRGRLTVSWRHGFTHARAERMRWEREQSRKRRRLREWQRQRQHRWRLAVGGQKAVTTPTAVRRRLSLGCPQAARDRP